MQRSSLFLNKWLVSQVGEEIGPRATFARFKQFIEDRELQRGETVVDLLPTIRGRPSSAHRALDARNGIGGRVRSQSCP
jgi:hypothetical protein